MFSIKANNKPIAYFFIKAVAQTPNNTKSRCVFRVMSNIQDGALRKNN